MRIIIISDGNTIYIHNWILGLEKAGAEVHVITIHPPTESKKHIHSIKIPKLLGKFAYFASVPSARTLIKKLQPDLVIAYFATGYGTVAALSGFHPLVIVTAGSDLFVSPQKSKFTAKQLQYNLKQADLVIALAPHMAQKAIEFGATNEQLMIMPFGIPLENFIPYRCPEPNTQDILKIISTRAFRPIYHLDKLIQGAALVQGEQPQLTLVGQGDLYQELVNLAEHHGVQVDFPGFIPNHELGKVLSEHHVYVALTETDGVSASLLEAMAVGLTPIVMNIDANRFWINDGENGILLTNNEPQTIATAIQRVQNDTVLRKRATQQNIEIIQERGDLYRNSERFVQRFRQLVQEHKTP